MNTTWLGINELQAKAICEYWSGTENDLQMEFCHEDTCCSTMNLDVPGGHDCTCKSFNGSSLGSCADFQFVSGPLQGRVFQLRNLIHILCYDLKVLWPAKNYLKSYATPLGLSWKQIKCS